MNQTRAAKHGTTKRASQQSRRIRNILVPRPSPLSFI